MMDSLKTSGRDSHEKQKPAGSKTVDLGSLIATLGIRIDCHTTTLQSEWFGSEPIRKAPESKR